MSYSLRAVAGKSAAFNGLRKLIAGMEAIASGEGVARTIDRAVAYVDKSARGELERKKLTGKAASTALIKGSRASLSATFQAYTLAGNFKPGSKAAPAGKPGGHLQWSYYKGFPRHALTRIGKIFTEETGKLLGLSPSRPSGDA